MGTGLATKGPTIKTDIELEHDVERELEWEPSVDERRTAASVVGGIVTLSGEVSSYAEKWNAERAAERVLGARGVANELEVRSINERSDSDIAHAAADALKWDVMVPPDKVSVEVRDGWVTLTGEVNWDYQRRAAEQAVRNLYGANGISNLVLVQPRVGAVAVKEGITDAFKRTAVFDADHITVQAIGGDVVLRGSGLNQRRRGRQSSKCSSSSVQCLTTVQARGCSAQARVELARPCQLVLAPQVLLATHLVQRRCARDWGWPCWRRNSGDSGTRA